MSSITYKCPGVGSRLRVRVGVWGLGWDNGPIVNMWSHGTAWTLVGNTGHPLGRW